MLALQQKYSSFEFSFSDLAGGFVQRCTLGIRWFGH